MGLRVNLGDGALKEQSEAAVLKLPSWRKQDLSRPPAVYKLAGLAVRMKAASGLRIKSDRPVDDDDLPMVGEVRTHVAALAPARGFLDA